MSKLIEGEHSLRGFSWDLSPSLFCEPSLGRFVAFFSYFFSVWCLAHTRYASNVCGVTNTV